MFLDGFLISSYRSFGKCPQKIGPLGKINLLIGQNNSGKSNIIYFLEKHFNGMVTSIKSGQKQQIKFNDLDKHIGEPADEISFGLCWNTESKLFKNYIDTIAPKTPQLIRINQIINKLFSSKELVEENIAWFIYNSSAFGQPFKMAESFFHKISPVLEKNEWNALWNRITGMSGGDLLNHWVPQSLKKLSPENLPFPKIDGVPAIRSVSEPPSMASDYSGKGIIQRLAKLQNPSVSERHLSEKFEKINVFIQSVTENKTCKIEIPYERDVVLVHMDAKILPLESLGTGIHEVIIMAAAATILENQILCIEEPEIHLHPSLQKKLIYYLLKETTNQYFISTHSAHFLDIPEVKVFHVRNINGTSEVSLAYSDRKKSDICMDLGYHPSDLLQANSIIWVEGPSDRIYLNNWINEFDPNLVEGIHYSIMFYGGKLLSHVTGDEQILNDFISLRRLNRNICIIMDSDKDSSRKRINSTKKRLRNEFDEGPGFAWITKGREIENYIKPEILEKAIKKIHGENVSIIKTGEYANCLEYKNEHGKPYKEKDKVRLAREVIKCGNELNRLDLKQNINKLVSFIKKLMV